MRRFLQFNLRTTFAAITLFSVICGCVSAHFRDWQAEQVALAALQPNQVNFDDSRMACRPAFHALVFT